MPELTPAIAADVSEFIQDTSAVATPPPPGIILTNEQQLAVKNVIDFVTNKDPILGKKNQYELGGYAGTGKTTVAKTIIAELRKLGIRSAVCAFTGKAVSVLERKGISASTIHSTIYHAELIKGQGYVFYLRSNLEGSPQVILIDEASMISRDLLRDLSTFGKKLVFLGDPGQLEPVGDNPNLMKRPDFILSKIHRQAEQSPILTLATSVRQGGTIVKHPKPPADPTNFELYIRDKSLTVRDLLKVSQVICAKNKTRKRMNEQCREGLGFPLGTLCVKDKIMILRNNLEHNVFNGLILFIDAVHSTTDTTWVADAHDEVGNKYHRLNIWRKGFQVEKLDAGDIPPKKHVIADYAYAITCHKSQGSEWDHVLVYDEWMPPTIWDMKRWRYTAITRAAKQLTYCI